jgi:hypothetical protein
MPIPTLPPSTSLPESRSQWLYTQARIEADTRLHSIADTLAPWESLWQAAAVEHQKLDDAVVRAAARVDVADGVLDALVDRVDLALQAARGKDRSHPLFATFFAGQAPSALKRPVLGPQLETVRTWPDRLAKSGVPALVALQADMQQAADVADAALAAHQKAAADLDNFETVGLGKQLVDKLNAMRDAVHGELKQVRHDHPDWNLAADWPDSFFIHDSRGAHVVRSSADAEARVKQLEAKLAAARASLADLQAKEAKDAKAKQDQASLVAQAADAAKVAKEAAAKAKALKAASKKKRS